MTNKDKVFFNAAKEISQLSDFKKYHIGCVIVDKNRVISSGFSCNKTNPIQKRYNSLRFSVDSTPHKLHAETKALLPLLKLRDADRSRWKVYLYREHANGTLAMSRPCPSCMALLKDSGIHRIFYTTDDGYAEEEI